MISCQNITKIFDGRVVINSLTHHFEHTGFYLLFGESGSGKTTFLNILSGFLPFEEGSILWNDKTFTGQVDNAITQNDFDYITQDAFFVDFLSVMDNMRLISDDDDKIINLLSRFNLADKIEQRPTTLSGGEKQRLAIIRALLNGKRVLLLDEPTAALDEDNKLLVLELLSVLKQQVLIICSSHDDQAKNFADEILYFSKEEKNSTVTIPPMKKAERKKTKSPRPMKKKKLDRFLIKWFTSERRNKKATVMFTAFLVLSLCLCIFADTPENKLETSMEHIYKINMFTVTTYGKIDWEDIAPSTEGVMEVALNYGGSCPDGTENLSNDILMRPSPEYETALHTLPFQEKCFKLSNAIKYGSYFTKRNQIILSSEMAQALFPDDPQKAIGHHIEKEVYGFGQIEFEIIGVFRPFNDFEKMYLKALDIHIDSGTAYTPENYKDLFFVNSEFGNSFEKNKNFYSGGNYKRVYQIYFDSYRAMKSYYSTYAHQLKDNENVFVEYSSLHSSLYAVFELLFFISLPIAAFMVLFSILFFIALKRLEYVYNNKFIAVFEYAGYSKRRVIRHFILWNIVELLIIYAVAISVTFIITPMVNIINNMFGFVNFQVFSFNPYLILSFLLFMLIVSLTFVPILLHRVKIISWYDNLIAGRDLI